MGPRLTANPAFIQLSKRHCGVGAAWQQAPALPHFFAMAWSISKVGISIAAVGAGVSVTDSALMSAAAALERYWGARGKSRRAKPHTMLGHGPQAKAA